MLLTLVAAMAVGAALVGAHARPPWSRWAALAVALAGLAVVVATRRAWEFDVRRPVWIADAVRGRWLERGVDWLLAALALTAAAALRALGGSPSRRAWHLAAVVGALSVAALAWGGLRR